VSHRDYRISELVAMIENGQLQLPEMQRQYVWTSTKVRDLLDSLYRGYPSGLILMWQTPHDSDVATREFAVAANAAKVGSALLLLDGQQRLTSLSSVLRGEPVSVGHRKRPVDILFNLNHPDELTFITEVDEPDDADAPDEAELSVVDKANRRAFVVASNAILAQDNWVKVSDVFARDETEILQSAGLTGWDDPRFKRYQARLAQLRRIREYVYRAEVLAPTMSYEEVTEIFVRVNSQGVKLRSSDLAMAQITARWRGSLDLFTSYKESVAAKGFDFDLSVYLRTMIATLTGQSRFLTVGSLTKEQLEPAWEDTKRVVDFAIDYLRSNFGIDSPTVLSSPFLVTTVAYWAHVRDLKIAPSEAAAFRQWFLVANAKGRYSRGSSETLLDQDLAALRKDEGVGGLLARLQQQFGRLDFTPADLVGKSARSGAFKTMFILFAGHHARDWKTSLVISPKHQNKADKIEFHHIFPKDYLKTNRPELSDAEINDIANLAFIGSGTNKQVSAKAPAEYRGVYADEDFAAQLIDFDAWGDQAGDYERFIAERRAEIAAALNEFFGLETHE